MGMDSSPKQENTAVSISNTQRQRPVLQEPQKVAVKLLAYCNKLRPSTRQPSADSPVFHMEPLGTTLSMLAWIRSPSAMNNWPRMLVRKRPHA